MPLTDIEGARDVVTTTGKTKFLLSGIGTRGDLFPLIALASELGRRGHDCALLSNWNFGAYADARGIELVPVAEEQVDNTLGGRESLRRYVFPSYQPTVEYVRKERALGRRLAVVNLDSCSASNLVVELYGLPLCRLHLAPWSIQSTESPPWPFSRGTRGLMPKSYRKFALPELQRRMNAAPFLMDFLNGFRRGLGLKDLSGLRDIDSHIGLRLGLFPEFFGSAPSDWPSNLKMVGFPLPRSKMTLPHNLSEFLSRNAPRRPIIFTPGTGVVDVNKFFFDAKACCQHLKRPGVFLSRHYSTRGGHCNEDILHLPFVDLDLLLAHASCLVHHGGIGTTARAFEAGIPQVVVSELYDQPDNGQRVEMLGAGRFFEPGCVGQQGLTRVVGEVLDSVEMHQRVESYAQVVRAEDGVARAVDQLVQFAKTAGYTARVA